jgi:CRISPR-associated endonuclease/helicase Cas3
MAWLYATHEEEGPHASSWFEQGKRGLLAPFGAGTLDQALMSVINVRHPAVRSYGLAGKAVILDEVHSYDAYTGTLLDVLVKHLRSLGCTVIILSATLTQSRLRSIIGASGWHASQDYPLITAVNEAGTGAVGVVRDAPDADVMLDVGAGEDASLEEALVRAEQGQQVLWIENTVGEAQQRYRNIAARAAGMDIETGLLHSRFTPSDRQRNEARWTGLYGKSSAGRAVCGRILIGTQVLEQSLDIDADFLVTRLCPTDMLFQRMGRLWRHGGTKRPPGSRRECWVLSPSLKDARENERAFGPSGTVYSPYVLGRTLETWDGSTSVSLPGGIRPLLEATYAERPLDAEPSPLMQRRRSDLEKRRKDMQTLALSQQSEGRTLPDAAATRFMEDDLSSLLIVRELNGERCVLADG